MKLRQQPLDSIHDLDDVGARLALDVHDHRRGLVHPGGLLHVLGIVDRIGDVGQLHRRAVAIGDDQRPVVLARQELIVRADDRSPSRAVERALGLIDVGGSHHRAQVFKGQSVGGQGSRVGLNPHGRPLPAADADEPHARQLRNLLGKPGIREIFNLRQGHGVRRQRQRQNRRIGRVDLVVDGRVRKILRQESRRRIDGRLHLLFGHVQAEVQAELQRDDRAATRTGRRHLFQAGHLPELAFQRGGDGGRHHVRTRARVEGDDLDGRVIHLREGGDRQLSVGQNAGEQNRRHQ